MLGCHIMCRALIILPKETLSMLYNVIVLLHFDDGDVIYENCSAICTKETGSVSKQSSYNAF